MFRQNLNQTEIYEKIRTQRSYNYNDMYLKASGERESERKMRKNVKREAEDIKVENQQLDKRFF